MLDHGILNLPLSKRMGNIDAEIDRYKARKAKEERDAWRAQQTQHKIDQGKAKQMVAELSDERAGQLCTSLKLTRKQLRVELNRIAHWSPKRILAGI